MIVFKMIVFVKLVVLLRIPLLTIVNDDHLLTIVNNDSLLTIVNNDPSLTIVKEERRREETALKGIGTYH